MADKYLLRVTAGPSYDPTSHQTVAVNSGTTTRIHSPLCDTSVSVRIQNYRGLPRGSPSTSSYFSHPPHTHDQYSISFSFIPHRTISGRSLVFGNDFEHPVRDRIPPGFSAAFRIVKWAIDPALMATFGENSLDSVINTEAGQEEEAITEGGFDGGQELREILNIPENAAARQKWFLGGHDRLENWQWEKGRLYKADFFNPYLDFNEFALKLPGFSLKVLGYLGGEDYLRYVLKDKETGEVLFVVVFTLLPKEQVEAEEAESSQPSKSDDAKDATQADKSFEPHADDLD